MWHFWLNAWHLGYKHWLLKKSRRWGFHWHRGVMFWKEFVPGEPPPAGSGRLQGQTCLLDFSFPRHGTTCAGPWKRFCMSSFVRERKQQKVQLLAGDGCGSWSLIFLGNLRADWCTHLRASLLEDQATWGYHCLMPWHFQPALST